MGLDVQYIASQLPVEPDEGVKDFVRKNWHELGGFVTLFRRVSAKGLADYSGEPLRGFIGECWCSECENIWHTAWGSKSVIVADGDDGMIYPISPYAAEFGADLTTSMGDGSTGICPMCGEGVTFRLASKFGRRQMTRRHFLVFRRIGQYTALVSWLACREIFPDKRQYYELVPWVANVVDERGLLRGFRFDPTTGQWRKAGSPVTPESAGYLSGDGYYGYVRGGFVELPGGDLAGETGAKTGVREYLAAGGCFATGYLRIWRQYRGIENLMKTGFAKISAEMVNSYSSGYRSAFDGLDLSKAKPHEIAGVSRADFRVICRDGWSWEAYGMFRKASGAGLVADCAEFSALWPRYHDNGFRQALALRKDDPGLTMAKIDRYLARQNLQPSDLHHMLDYRRMYQRAYLVPPGTAEELWPRNLLDAHDRVSMLVSTEDESVTQQAFDRTAARLAPLAWTDGELCIVIPRSAADLKHEGRVLRHCVGGYAASHVGGAPIFFVRHRRRPERPYYTLNISLSGDAPRRVQLHGYGNERHGDRKQYSHRIPRKVLEFCDRWEREVLAPFWADLKKE